MPTSFALIPHFDAFIREQLESGRYNNASEVVREGMRLLERQQRAEALKVRALCRAAAEGFAAIDAGQYVDAEPADLEMHIAALGEAVAPQVSRKTSRRRS